MKAAAKTLRPEVTVVNTGAPAEFEKAFAEIARERAAGLPVEQPTKFELIVNQRTARDLGIKIPDSILLRVEQFSGRRSG